MFLVLRVFDPAGKEVTFIGSNDPRVPVGLGWLRASQRKLDPQKSLPYRPWHTHDEEWPLTPGEPVELDIEIWPTSIVVPPGYQLALTVRGKDYEVDGTDIALPNAPYPMKGVGPFLHVDPDDRPADIFATRNTLHFAAGRQPYLLLPIIPDQGKISDTINREELMTMKHIAGIAAAALRAARYPRRPASAQQYPSRTITIIVPYPAGGPTDRDRAHGRAIAVRRSSSRASSSRISAAATPSSACEKVARAAPDGYTLLLPNLQISANVTLYKKLPFDTVKDFTPVMLINRNPLVLVGRNTLAPQARCKDLIALMKKQTLKAAIPGYGATGHLATALFAQEAGVKVDMIPYRGAAPAITDLLGGQVDLFFATPQSVVQQVATGEAEGVRRDLEAEDLPNCRTCDSFVTVLGPKLDFVYWQALFAPSETPKAVIKTLNEAAQKAVADPAIVKNWAATRHRRLSAGSALAGIRRALSSRARLHAGAK